MRIIERCAGDASAPTHHPRPPPPLHGYCGIYVGAGEVGMGGGGACAALVAPNAPHNTPEESQPDEDKHKAPSSTQPLPLSLQNFPHSPSGRSCHPERSEESD